MPTPIENNTTQLQQLIEKANNLPDKSDGSTSTKVLIEEMYCYTLAKGIDGYEGQEHDRGYSFYMYINGIQFINSEYGESPIDVDGRYYEELQKIYIDPFEIDTAKDFIAFITPTNAICATYIIDGNKLIVQAYFN